MKRLWIRRGLAFLAFAVLFLGLAGLAVSGLWNWLIPSLFAGPTITFGQALGLLVLARLLVGGFRGGVGPRRWGYGGWDGRRGGHPRYAHWKQKMAERWEKMTPEEREQLRHQWGSRCGPGNRRWEQNPPRSTEEPTTTQI